MLYRNPYIPAMVCFTGARVFQMSQPKKLIKNAEKNELESQMSGVCANLIFSQNDTGYILQHMCTDSQLYIIMWLTTLQKHQVIWSGTLSAQCQPMKV